MSLKGQKLKLFLPFYYVQDSLKKFRIFLLLSFQSFISYSRRIKYIITINVPVVYMARDIMISCGQHPLQWPLEGVGPENRDFLGPEMATTEASAIWAQKSRDFSVS